MELASWNLKPLYHAHSTVANHTSGHKLLVVYTMPTQLGQTIGTLCCTVKSFFFGFFGGGGAQVSCLTVLHSGRYSQKQLDTEQKNWCPLHLKKLQQVPK